ncbi:MAG: peptidoglycan-binding domain-containing protein, partial [Candidatus Komeilibacteria bacterium]|nr:peptidoglycan-binding domain-containing protein [Candidatus Komeilibacteria bacterium]
ITLNNGQNVKVTVYGGIGSNYFIYSNSNSDIADITISNNILSITAKSTLGTTTLRVCSATIGASCADLLVTTTLTPVVITNPIALSQTNVSLNPAQTTTITVTGGSANKSYIVSSNSNSSVVTAKVSGSTITLNGGDSDGSAIVSVCDSVADTVCASIYVTVKNYLVPLSFSQNRVTLTVGKSTNIVGYYSGTGGGGLNVMFNSNPDVVTADIKGSSSIAITAGPATGSATIAVCSAATPSDCAHIYVLSIAPAIIPETPAAAAAITGNTSLNPQVKGETVSNYKFNKQLATGASGTDVRELQTRLTAEKVYSGPITGFFGAQTRAAVKLYQKNHGLSQVGVLGPATRALLNK